MRLYVLIPWLKNGVIPVNTATIRFFFVMSVSKFDTLKKVTQKFSFMLISDCGEALHVANIASISAGLRTVVAFCGFDVSLDCCFRQWIAVDWKRLGYLDFLERQGPQVGNEVKLL